MRNRRLFIVWYKNGEEWNIYGESTKFSDFRKLCYEAWLNGKLELKTTANGYLKVSHQLPKLDYNKASRICRSHKIDTGVLVNYLI